MKNFKELIKEAHSEGKQSIELLAHNYDEKHQIGDEARAFQKENNIQIKLSYDFYQPITDEKPMLITVSFHGEVKWIKGWI